MPQMFLNFCYYKIIWNHKQSHVHVKYDKSFCMKRKKGNNDNKQINIANSEKKYENDI